MLKGTQKKQAETVAIKDAHKLWGKVARGNGWSMAGRFVTVWMYRDGEVADSLYSPENATADVIYYINRPRTNWCGDRI